MGQWTQEIGRGSSQIKDIGARKENKVHLARVSFGLMPPPCQDVFLSLKIASSSRFHLKLGISACHFHFQPTQKRTCPLFNFLITTEPVRGPCGIK